MANAHKLVPFILKWEGGFVDDPLDKGGATNKGITLKTFQYHFGKNKTVNDLKHITDEQWFEIFKEDFWDRWKADDIKNQSIANILVEKYLLMELLERRRLKPLTIIPIKGCYLEEY